MCSTVGAESCVSWAVVVYLSPCEAVKGAVFTALSSSLSWFPLWPKKGEPDRRCSHISSLYSCCCIFFSFLHQRVTCRAFLGGCVTWFEAKPGWDRGRGAEEEGGKVVLSLPCSVSYCAFIFVSLLHSCGELAHRWLPQLTVCHAWPTLSSPVYYKPPLITLHTIKENILITACLIINSHWENEMCNLTSAVCSEIRHRPRDDHILKKYTF